MNQTYQVYSSIYQKNEEAKIIKLASSLELLFNLSIENLLCCSLFLIHQSIAKYQNVVRQ